VSWFESSLLGDSMSVLVLSAAIAFLQNPIIASFPPQMHCSTFVWQYYLLLLCWLYSWVFSKILVSKLVFVTCLCVLCQNLYIDLFIVWSR